MHNIIGLHRGGRLKPVTGVGKARPQRGSLKGDVYITIKN